MEKGVGAGAQPRALLPAPVHGPQRRLQGECPHHVLSPWEPLTFWELASTHTPRPPTPPCRPRATQIPDPAGNQASVSAHAKCRKYFQWGRVGLRIKQDPAAFPSPRSQTGREGEPGGPLSHKVVSWSFGRSPCCGGGEGAASGKDMALPAKYTSPIQAPTPATSAIALGFSVPIYHHPPGGGSHRREDVVTHLLQQSLEVRKCHLLSAWRSLSAVSPPPFHPLSSPCRWGGGCSTIPGEPRGDRGSEPGRGGA